MAANDYHAHKQGPLHSHSPVHADPAGDAPSSPLPSSQVPDDGNHPVIQTTEVNGDGGVPGSTDPNAGAVPSTGTTATE
jgi:hypothetical protein